MVFVQNAFNFFIYRGEFVEVVYYLSPQSLLSIFTFLVPLREPVGQEHLFFFPLLEYLMEVTHEMQI